MESAFRSFLTCLLLAFLVLTLALELSRSFKARYGTVVDPTGAIVPARSESTNAKRTRPHHDYDSADCSSCFAVVGSIGGDHKSGLPQSFLAGLVSPWRRYRTGKHQIGGWIHLRTVESLRTPLIETTQSQITNTFDTSDVASIPGSRRTKVGLAGVLLRRERQPRRQSREHERYGLVVNGLRGRSNDQEIDGQYNNDNSVTGPAIFVGNSEFVNQYQITTTTLARSTGATLVPWST